MMAQIAKLEEQQKKWLAVGIFLIAILLIFIVTILPAMYSYSSNDDEISLLTKQWRGYSQVALSKDIVSQQLKKMRQRQPGKKFYLKSRVENLATSELTNIIRKTVGRHQSEVQSTNGFKVKEKDQTEGFRKVSVKVVFRGNVNTLHAVLLDLEMGEPFLFIDKTYVRKRNVRNSRSAKLIEGELDIQLIVSGYVQQAGGG
jgi:hypothetical protein